MGLVREALVTALRHYQELLTDQAFSGQILSLYLPRLLVGSIGMIWIHYTLAGGSASVWDAKQLAADDLGWIWSGKTQDGQVKIAAGMDGWTVINKGIDRAYLGQVLSKRSSTSSLNKTAYAVPGFARVRLWSDLGVKHLFYVIESKGL